MKINFSIFQKLGFWYKGSQRLVNTAGFIFLAVILIGGTALMLFNNEQQKKAAQIRPAEEISALPGWWFRDYFGASVCESPECQPTADPDQDGLNNAQEFYYHSSPLDADTNKNGNKDGEDVANDIDPSREGDVTFDQVASDENIFGESLLFEQDVKAEIAKSLDPSQIKLPLLEDRELDVIKNSSNEAAIDYVVAVNRIITKYFTKDQAAFIEQAIKSKETDRLQDVRLRAAKVEAELKQLSVPSDFLMIHKYTVALFNLMGKVVIVPGEDVLENGFNNTGNAWFDDAQAFMYLIEKTSNEYARLKQFYNIAD